MTEVRFRKRTSVKFFIRERKERNCQEGQAKEKKAKQNEHFTANKLLAEAPFGVHGKGKQVVRAGRRKSS